MKRKLQTKNFFLKESYVNSSGDSMWDIVSKNDQKTFFIHVFENGHLNIQFKKTFINNPQDAIKALCIFLINQGLVPTIMITRQNNSLIGLCRKSGFKKVKHTRNLYIFSVKN